MKNYKNLNNLVEYNLDKNPFIYKNKVYIFDRELNNVERNMSIFEEDKNLRNKINNVIFTVEVFKNKDKNNDEIAFYINNNKIGCITT